MDAKLSSSQPPREQVSDLTHPNCHLGEKGRKGHLRKSEHLQDSTISESSPERSNEKQQWLFVNSQHSSESYVPGLEEAAGSSTGKPLSFLAAQQGKGS